MGAYSKGCITCISRRVKCDQTQPACNRCKKANISCKGYRSLIVIDESSRIQRSRATVEAQIQQNLTLRKRLQVLDHSKSRQTFQPVEAQGSSISTFPLTAFKQNVFISFLAEKLCEGRGQNDMNCVASNSKKGLWPTRGWWAEDLLEKPSKSLEALAAMFFGRVHELQEVKMEGLVLYSEALKELRAELAHINGNWSFRTLASMTALCLYELVAVRAGLQWKFHALALSRVIEFGGPWRYKAIRERSAFLEHRMILLSQSMLSRRGSFLAQMDWKRVPWEAEPSSKQPIDYLMDILADVTVLIEDTDRLSITLAESEFIALQRKVDLSFQQLDEWWREWVKSNPESCTEVTPNFKSTVMVDELGLLYPTLLQYKSFPTGYTVCIHNTIRIQLLTLSDRVQHIIGAKLLSPCNSFAPQEPFSRLLRCDYQPTSSIVRYLPLLGISTNAIGLAQEIFRSIEYCFSQSRHYLGTFCLLFPLDFAYGVLGPNSREAKWLMVSDMGKLAEMAGFPNGARVTRLLPTYRFQNSHAKF